MVQAFRADMITTSNIVATTPTQIGHSHIEILKSELMLCLTFLFVSTVQYESGQINSAEKSLANAEIVYSMLAPLVLTLKHSQYATGTAVETLTAEFRQLREALDERYRLKPCPDVRAWMHQLA